MSTKRILSLVLALVMVLGTFGTVFAAPETASEKAEFLKSKGVLVGNNAGDLMLDRALKRDEAAVLLSRLYGNNDEEVVDTEMPFTDVKGATAPFVAWAHKEGLVAGTSATTFNPGGPLTAQQFASLLLRALGYEATPEAYATAFEDAKELGILEGVTVEEKGQLNRAQMAEMTYNALNVKMADGEKTLAEKLGIEMPGTEVLEVEDVYADNLKEIKLELNNAKLVDVDEVEDARNYRTDAGEVVEAKLEGNTIVLTLKETMAQNRKYELTTRYIKGIDLDKKVFTAYDNQAPAVEKVTVLGTKGIRVRMTEPVQGAEEVNFLLNGKNFVMRVHHYGRDILLLPYREDGTFAEGKHDLTVGQLTDFAGFRSKAENHEIEIVEDKTKPEVAKVIARNNSVIVEFVNEVHPDSVNKKNVSWTEVRGRNATEANDAVMLAGNKVEYKFAGSRELPKPAATIRISGLENYSGYVMDAYEEVHTIEVDYSRPEIVSHKFTAKNVMEIEFNKELDSTTDNSAENTDNYVLYGYSQVEREFKVSKYAIANAELKPGNKVVKVTFVDGTLVEGNRYKLEVSKVRDNTVLKNTMIADSIEFTYGIGEKLEVVAVRERTAEKVVLEFNKDLVRREAEDLRNYEFELVGEVQTRYFRASDLSKNPSAYLYGDGRTVELRLPGNGRAISTVHLGTAITALDGNRLDVAARIVDLTANRLKATKATLNAAGNKLTVEFNQKLVNQTITLAGITAPTGVSSASVVDGKLEIILDPAVDNVTSVVITAAANVQGVYDNAPVAASLAAANITNNRDIVASITSVAVNVSTATIEVTLNKKVSTDVQKATDLLVGGTKYASLSDASNIAGGTVYTFNITNQTVLGKLQTLGTVVKVVNASEGINESHTIVVANLDSAVANQQAANGFKVAHAAILGKEVADIDLDDLAAVKVARNAYNALNGAVQALLTDENTKLTALEGELLIQAQAQLTDTKARVIFNFNTPGTAADADTLTVDGDTFNVKTTPAVAGEVSVTVAQALYNAHDSADNTGTNVDILIQQNALLISNINLFLDSVTQ